jgi:hypothetical protein
MQSAKKPVKQLTALLTAGHHRTTPLFLCCWAVDNNTPDVTA